MEVKKWLVNARVPLGMLMVQVISTGLQLLSRVIISEGIFIFALIAYRHVVGAFVVAPFALYWERGAAKKLNFATLFWLFLVALTGVPMGMGLFYYGLKDTTATYAMNFLTLIPVVTFLFSTILGMEKLRVHTWGGKLKTLGAILCLIGALIVTLYKGKSFHLSHHINHPHKFIDKSHQNKTRGTFFLLGSCLCYGIWFIQQAKLSKGFTYKYSATMFTCIIASVQATVIGFCMDPNPKAWRVGWNLHLITIFYSGILATGASFCLISWTITKRGPTYPSMFNPLSLIMIAITEVLFLGEELSIGSLIGMGLIIVGLYSFLWGKNVDMKRVSRLPVKETAGDSRGVVSTAAGLESSAAIVPTASPDIIEEKS